MRGRPHRRNLILWSASALPVGWHGNPRRGRPARIRRIRWWLRTGALLAVLGVLRLGRTARARWEPVALLAGTLLTLTGFLIPSVSGVFLLGLGVLIVTLLKGIRQQRPAGAGR